jgi:alanine dehydrogenase
VLVLTRDDVEALLDPDALIEAVARAMADLSAGVASVPARVAAMVDDRDAFLAAMPSFVPSLSMLESKLVSVFPRNTDRPTHQALILTFDPVTGTPEALIDGTVVTEARTAAASALSARLLARDDAEVLAILGTGVEAAVREADVVCACTHADRPVVRRAWLRPGAHVASVGYNPSGEGEVDQDLVAEAAVVVESRAAALAPAPAGAVELVRAIEAGRIADDHIRAELGELVAGTARGRSSDEEITLYKSVGVAVQDAAAARLVLDAARERGLGTELAL